MPPRTDEPARAGGLRTTRVALAQARASAAEARWQSQQLRERAAAASRTALAARELIESHRQLWAEWHRGWAALRALPGVGPTSRRLLRVCAYCGAAALPGAGGDEWRPVPPAVRDLWREDAFGMRPSHGACPGCASARLGD